MDVVKVGKAERLGVLFTFVLGGMLKISYAWSGGAVWSILFGAANKSIWEHVKVFALPYLLWLVFELMIVRVPIRRMVVSKCIGLVALIALLIGGGYLLSLLPGGGGEILKLALTFLAVGLCHLLSFWLLSGAQKIERWFCASAFCLVLVFVMLMTFTLHPPKISLFYDSEQNQYGMYNVTETIAEGNLFAAVR